MPDGDFDEVIFSATLRPHRSLGRRGFIALMLFIASLGSVAGLWSVALGAWPVLGFVALDVVAIWAAFRLNYRAARAREEVEVSRTALVLRKIGPGGRAQEIRFNPAWVRLEVERLEDEGVERIAIGVRGSRFPVGAFLNPDDRGSFARAFGAALAQARR